MSIQMGELAIEVDGKKVFSYKQSGEKMPSDAELLSKVVPAGAPRADGAPTK
jgi:hypothetical protein